MDRRDFFKLASAAGLCVGGIPLLGRAFGDAESTGTAPIGNIADTMFSVTVQATGGWDPTLLCDPKAELNQSYGEAEIGSAGNVRYAPIPGAAEFFDAHYQRMLVINGVDVQTNSHDAGRRHMVSGRLGEGYPTLAALSAGFSAPELPMSFLSFGGYDITSGLVAATRDFSSNRLAELAHPDRINGTQPDGPTYHSEKAQAMIRLARQARSEKILGEQRLPRYTNSMDSLMTARLGADELQRLEEVLPEPDADANRRRIQLLVAARKAEICVAGNLSRGGFDTHDSHDANHIPRMTSLIGDVGFLWEEAERQGVADKLLVIMTSDFGRTPNYNADNGKDHWSVSSMILMGEAVPGNRVVGLTDAGHNPIELDPVTLEAADADAEETTRIGPDHVHRNVRRLLDIEGSEIDEAFPISVTHDLDLLA